jgi:diguanylate cyclase (GGDEF)-like protein
VNHTFIARLIQTTRLPSPPAVAVRVLDLVQDPRVSVASLAGAISHDPSLSTKVLQTANSSFYAQARTIRSITDAIVVLGLNSVRTLALGFSLVENLRKHKHGGFDHDAFWRRSLVTAVAARAVASRISPQHKEEAFLGGLLLKLGVLALSADLDRAYDAAFRKADGDYTTLRELELAAFGATHDDIGVALVEAWNLPPALAECMRHHANPDAADADAAILVKAVAAGDAVADLFSGREPDRALVRYRQAAGRLGLDADAADTLLTEIEGSSQAMEAVLNLPPGKRMSSGALLARANELLAQMSIQAAQEAARLANENRALATAAATDPLTGSANRRYFEECVEEQFRLATRYGSIFSVLFIDLDHFKSVNDTCGHAVGDDLLVAVADALRRTARGSDVVARPGGDEFAVLMPSTPLAEAAIGAERLREAIERVGVRAADGSAVGTTASIGVAQLDLRVHQTADALVADADRNVYQAKASGRNRVSARPVVSAA